MGFINHTYWLLFPFRQSFTIYNCCNLNVYTNFEKRPHHLTLLLEFPLITRVSMREVFCKQVTQHLT